MYSSVPYDLSSFSDVRDRKYEKVREYKIKNRPIDQEQLEL